MVEVGDGHVLASVQEGMDMAVLLDAGFSAPSLEY